MNRGKPSARRSKRKPSAPFAGDNAFARITDNVSRIAEVDRPPRAWYIAFACALTILTVFLGSIGWFDTLYLPLVQGPNEFVVAVSESFGGWGVQARFPDAAGLRLA